MNLFYNETTETWYTNEKYYTFGHLEESLAVNEPDPAHPSFTLTTSDNHLGPLIGIMVARNKQKKLVGNETLIKGLQEEVSHLGGILILFPPEWVNSDYVNGFVYCSTNNRWMNAKAPFPNIVYNRIPFRSKEKQEVFYQALSYFQKKKIPFFNPSFLNKWELYQLLSKDSTTKDFLPKTFLLSDFNQLMDIVETYKNVYIKPIEGHKGQDIYRIRKTTNHEYMLSSTRHTEVLTSLEGFWKEKWQENHFLIQEEVNAALYQHNRYDFRILVHFNKGNYSVSGVGVRQSKQQDVTTHIPSGGKLIPYEEVETDSHNLFIQALAENCGNLLSSHYGFFGEFSIDACVDKEGKYFLFEINSKPMLFDESYIENTRYKRLSQLFFELTKFHYQE